MPRDRPVECEIEITPEMIGTGVATLASYEPLFESEEDFIRRLLSDVFTISSKTALKRPGKAEEKPKDHK